jgi:hypothetical protein
VKADGFFGQRIKRMGTNRGTLNASGIDRTLADWGVFDPFIRFYPLNSLAENPAFAR